MKKIVLVFLSICYSLSFSYAQRGLLDRALNSATNAAERGITNAVSKKVESIAEKQMEAFLNKKLSAYEQYLADENKKYQEAMGAWQDSLVAMTSVPFEDEYVFNTLVQTDVEMTNEQGEKETLPCTYYLNSTADYSGYGVEGMVTVLDYKNNVMVCFSTNDTSKVYFAYKYATAEQPALDDESVQSIAGSKTVCGYVCSGYKIVGPTYTGNCWASSSADFSGKYTNMYVPKTKNGFPLYLEGVIYGENGAKVNYTAQAKSVKKNAAFTLRKADYKNMFE